MPNKTGIVFYHGIASGGEPAAHGHLDEDAGFASVRITERCFHEETFSALAIRRR